MRPKKTRVRGVPAPTDPRETSTKRNSDDNTDGPYRVIQLKEDREVIVGEYHESAAVSVAGLLRHFGAVVRIEGPA